MKLVETRTTLIMLKEEEFMLDGHRLIRIIPYEDDEEMSNERLSDLIDLLTVIRDNRTAE